MFMISIFIVIVTKAQSVDGEYWSFELIHIFYRVALGIGAASFASGASKDIAESPTAIAGTPKRKDASTHIDTSLLIFSIL